MQLRRNVPQFVGNITTKNTEVQTGSRIDLSMKSYVIPKTF